MKNFFLVALLLITFCVASKHEEHPPHHDCSHDPPHPHYLTIKELIDLKSDDDFRAAIQSFIDYFHEHACVSYQTYYRAHRIREITALSAEQNQGFFGRFVKVGFSPDLVDPIIGRETQQFAEVMKNGWQN